MNIIKIVGILYLLIPTIAFANCGAVTCTPKEECFYNARTTFIKARDICDKRPVGLSEEKQKFRECLDNAKQTLLQDEKKCNASFPPTQR